MDTLGIVMTNHNDSVSMTASTDMGECHQVHFHNASGQCDFVLNTPDCDIDEGLINYTHFVYCTLSSSLTVLAIIILIVWLIFLFVAMAVCADDFFCPPLVVMAKLLNMSDNVAGVTLLAFGNGAADVFSAIAAIDSSKKGDVGLAMGSLLGAGMFITTLIPGAISLITQCRVAQRPILRDIIFFLAAVYLTFVVLFSREISLKISIVFFCLYLLYVLVVVVGRYIYQRQQSSSDSSVLSVPAADVEESPTPEAVPSTPEIEQSVVNKEEGAVTHSQRFGIRDNSVPREAYVS